MRHNFLTLIGINCQLLPTVLQTEHRCLRMKQTNCNTIEADFVLTILIKLTIAFD